MSKDVQEMTIAETYRELWKGLKTLKPVDWLIIAGAVAVMAGLVYLMLFLAEHNINAFINVVWVGMVLGVTCLSFGIVFALNANKSESE